ncbi:DNA/RNA helicase domain-containing protein, partial [Bacillus sp. JJ722]|uniref:DNA/RNA helicase domain-containing protein n=1 Tax=Bacillus sp. JJ722 TaxID=3122973 RepID=UPI002FFFC44B
MSKENKNQFDWVEGVNKWKWNSTHEDWMNKKNSLQEIGSIHAVQGVDINCVGLIIGKDLSYQNGKIVGVSNNYYDKNGKPIINEFKESEFTDFIKNIYYTLMTRGIDGIRLYIEDESLKNYIRLCIE